MKIEIPVGDAKVISLDVHRESSRTRATLRKCAHRTTEVDTSLVKMKCLDCGYELNPIEWIADAAELFAAWKYEREQLIEERARYEAKKRCRCEHCNQITRVRPATSAEICEFKKETKQDTGRPL